MSVTSGPQPKSPWKQSLISFASGAAFGATSVVTAQPFDSLKTLTQAQSVSSASSNGVGRPPGMVAVAKDLFQRDGVKGFYRGAIPMLIGGALFRSAQFGCYDVAMQALGGPVPKSERVFFGALDPHVVMAGFVGGLGRGAVESPFGASTASTRNRVWPHALWTNSVPFLPYSRVRKSPPPSGRTLEAS